ncbi:MAG: TIGR00341 family protein [Thermoplasmata archaeon]|nr:MAG: TIGR00341 family protein [Thermoplasmata archaeon]
MRQIQIILPDRDVRKVLSIAQESNLKAAHVRSSGEIDLVLITVPDQMVNDFISKLKGADIHKVGTVSIMPIHASLSKVEPERMPTIAPKEEIIESARRACYLSRGYVFMIVVSSFVATLGLLLNSTAVVIGAMVIAPLLGPSIASCVGTVMGDTALFKKGIVSTFLGLLIVIIAAAATAFFVNALGLLPPLVDISVEELPKEIAERTTLNILIVGLALASGAAGAYSFAEKKGEILVGVMIAVALVPPAAIVGIGTALLDMNFIVSSGLLLAVNVICINIAGTLVFWRLGIRPGGFMEMMHSERSIKKRLFVTMIILIILGAILGWSTWEAYQDYQLERRIGKEALVVIENGNYTYIEDYEVDEIRLERGIFGLGPEKPVYVRILIYTNDTAKCKVQYIHIDILNHLASKFENENEEGFEVEIVYREVEVARSP